MPTLRVRHERPRKGDHVWLQSRYESDRQPNGYIIKFNWPEQQVGVKMYVDGAVEWLDLELFHGTWTDKYGGFYFPEGQDVVLARSNRPSLVDNEDLSCYTGKDNEEEGGFRWTVRSLYPSVDTGRPSVREREPDSPMKQRALKDLRKRWRLLSRKTFR
jgi:hypothetical protein